MGSVRGRGKERWMAGVGVVLETTRRERKRRESIRLRKQ
jgi:hypothetical protein